MWQKCPICNGTGINMTISTSSQHTNCSLCKGTLIIDTLTGQPLVVEEKDERDGGCIN